MPAQIDPLKNAGSSHRLFHLDVSFQLRASQVSRQSQRSPVSRSGLRFMSVSSPLSNGSGTVFQAVIPAEFSMGRMPRPLFNRLLTFLQRNFRVSHQDTKARRARSVFFVALCLRVRSVSKGSLPGASGYDVAVDFPVPLTLNPEAVNALAA